MPERGGGSLRLTRDEAVLHAAEQPGLEAGDFGGVGSSGFGQPQRRVGKPSSADPDGEARQMTASPVVQTGRHMSGEPFHCSTCPQAAVPGPAFVLPAASEPPLRCRQRGPQCRKDIDLTHPTEAAAHGEGTRALHQPAVEHSHTGWRRCPVAWSAGR